MPDELSEEEAQRQLDSMRAQLATTPAEVVVANHCYGLFELAAIYLSQTPPKLFEARLAIDGLGALLDGLRGRLGEAEPALLESLSQLRLAYVQLDGSGAPPPRATRAASAERTGVRPGPEIGARLGRYSLDVIPVIALLTEAL